MVYRRRLDDEEELDGLPPLEGDEEEVKEVKRLNIFNSKQIINQTSNIISTDKSSKQFIQIKKWNQTNIISFVSA